MRIGTYSHINILIIQAGSDLYNILILPFIFKFFFLEFRIIFFTDGRINTLQFKVVTSIIRGTHLAGGRGHVPRVPIIG